MRGASWLRRGVILAALSGVIAATRIPLAPKYLYYFDSVNFALALEEFNPTLHQPQPPGYPLHVAVLRMMRPVISEPERLFIAVGLLASVFAVALLWWLGELMFSPRAGIAAALLLAAHPVFWMACLSNQVRLWLAVGAAGVGIACWRALSGSRAGPAFFWACALLGLFAGFRPAMLIMLTPLVAYTAWRARPGWRWVVWGAAAMFAVVGSWLSLTAAAGGGWSQFARLTLDYSRAEFSPGSALFGAGSRAASHMFIAAAVWTCIGVPSWIWALAAVRPSHWLSPRTLFLAVWLAPAFLFHSIVHVGDPDHTLVSITALCLAGGALLASLMTRLNKEGWIMATGFAVAINVVIFFLPMTGLAGATGFRAVEYVDRATRETIASIRQLTGAGPAVLVCYKCFVTYRHLSYYFPGTPVAVLRQDYDHDPRDKPAVWLIRGRNWSEPEIQAGTVMLPPARRIIWVLSPYDPAAHAVLSRSTDVRQAGPVYWTPVETAAPVRFGAYTLAPSPAAPQAAQPAALSN